ncbi:DUF4258 domain-containing protein [Nonomuraea sp. NPDC047897]|uniref:DUF4258 domain-containing protein n=1 Tax=Nonomuraea sp. NPDC047897 TaxID=3364346 RepID=UPI003711B4C4
MPQPLLTQHVKERMELRGITEDQIFKALAREIRRRPGSSGKICVFGIVPGGRILKVVLTHDSTQIITAAWPDE